MADKIRLFGIQKADEKSEIGTKSAISKPRLSTEFNLWAEYIEIPIWNLSTRVHGQVGCKILPLFHQVFNYGVITVLQASTRIRPDGQSCQQAIPST
jgi:hypothetical protein